MNLLKRVPVSMLTGLSIAFIVYFFSQSLFYYPFAVVQSIIDDSHFSRKFKLYDAQGTPSESIVIIDIDKKSLSRLGNDISFWPRKSFTTVVDAVSRDNAAVIFLDILFTAGGNPEWNDSLAKAVSDAGTVVAGYYVNLDIPSRYQRPVDSVLNEQFISRPEAHLKNRVRLLSSNRMSFSYQELVQAANAIGYANYQPDFDGVLRHIPLFMEHQQWVLPSASLQIWLTLNGLHYTDALIAPDGISIGNTFIPTDRHTFMRINYRGGEHVYPRISFSDVLEGVYASGFFSGKTVMIGSSASNSDDLKRIPGKRIIPGVEVHAAALDTMLSGRFVRPLSGNTLFIINLLTGILSCVFFRYARPLRGGLAGLILLPLTYYIASMICFSAFDILLNTSIPTCTVLCTYVFVTFYLYCRKNVSEEY